MAEFVKIRSWHIVRTPTRAFDTFLTYCGRKVVTKEVLDGLPPDGKTCEACFRIRESAQ